MSFLFRKHGFGAVCCVFLLSACSSDSEGVDVLPTVTTAVDSIAFSVTSPDDPTPATRTFTATFSADTLYMAALSEGTAIERVTYALSGRTATISVVPKSPTTLGPGLHTARISILGQACADTGCSQLASGPAHFVSVTYAVPQIVREVAPYVALGQSGNVTLRGRGFQAFTVNNVLFGGFPAAAFSIVSDTQIDATYPALAAGRYGVQIQVDGAPVPPRSDAELVVIAAPAFTADVLTYSTVDSMPTRLLYDAERDALLIATMQNGGELLRFRHAGSAWGAAEVLPIYTLKDIALSGDGRTLLALTERGITPVDADTLVTGTAANASLDSGTTFTGIAIANHGGAVLTTSAGSNTTSPLYLFDPRTEAFTRAVSLNNALPFASGDGSLIVLPQQDATGATTPALYQLAASTGSISSTALAFNRSAIVPVLDRSATRIALNGLKVYDASYNLIGALPATTLASVFGPDGTRLYAYDSAAAAILTYDAATQVTSGSTLNLVDAPYTIAGDVGSAAWMAVSASGDTVFLVGPETIFVVPVTQ